MKRILAKLAQVDSEDAVNSYNNFGNSASSHHVSFVGRHYQMGHFSFVIEDTIAEGGFGMVFRVRSPQGQHYALKRTCVNSNQDLAVCKREITIVSSLSHKNILRYIDSRINRLSQGVYEVLLLTVYYPASLSQFIQERKQLQQRLTEVEVLRVFCDLCEAVCRLHHCKTPVIHRDLKVENVLIDERQNFVLCDFGSATSRVLLPSAHGLVRCKEEIDRYTTLAYRAPELIDLYSNVPLGPQIDIWAMGCLLYFLCFASLPFGDSALAIQSGNYSLPDSSPYSERLHKLIGYLLCTDAYKRPDIYQTCALTFTLSGRVNPAQNLNNLPVPHWQDLPTPPRESQLKSLPSGTERSHSPGRSAKMEFSAPRKSPDTAHPDVVGTSTSVVPRQRPRATVPKPAETVTAGPVRSVGADPRVINPPVPIALKPPPPPPNAPVSVPTISEPRSSSPFGDHQVLINDRLDGLSLEERTKQLGWNENFSDSFSPLSDLTGSIQSTSTIIPNANCSAFSVPSRGHQRTCSADVGYMNRVHQTYVRNALPKCSDAEESSYLDISPGTQTTENAFSSSSTQLRQTQSLASLPTSAVRTSISCLEPVGNVGVDVGLHAVDVQNTANNVDK
ncbi:AP2-associated protein kinase 1 [Fasciola gigantica]|uniref:non-specific serine/threonine protein kinase n=1 Tax=Fasciola gigantica TaxID=46835 RepID=A0A504YXC1_FASGI|nr:AP2-associated protein kinase 1 [Fasciola gigantica]